MVVSVVIALVSNIVDLRLLLRSIRSENFPVETSIFELHFTIEDFDKAFTDFSRSSELSDTNLTLNENLLHNGSITVDHVHIFFG